MQRNLPFKEATPQEIKQRLDAGEDLLLIDVREPEEVRIASIESAEVRPLSQARDWISTLPKDRELVVMCHHGGRSAQVAMALTQMGHTSVTNMTGGINAWSEQIDPSVPKY